VRGVHSEPSHQEQHAAQDGLVLAIIGEQGSRVKLPHWAGGGYYAESGPDYQVAARKTLCPVRGDLFGVSVHAGKNMRIVGARAEAS